MILYILMRVLHRQAGRDIKDAGAEIRNQANSAKQEISDGVRPAQGIGRIRRLVFRHMRMELKLLFSETRLGQAFSRVRGCGAPEGVRRLAA